MGLEIVGLLLAGAGASYGWWKLQTRRERLLLHGKQFEDHLDEDAKVIFTLAQHSASSRNHVFMTPLHLLYAIAQNEKFQEAVGKIEGNLEALDEHLLDKLDREPERKEMPDESVAYQHALGHAYLSAQSFDRQVSATDMFVYLFRADLTRALLEPCTKTPHALLFAMVHGMAEPESTLPDRTHVHVVIRNDDYTTREFVSTLLRDTFDLPEADAEARMMQTHNDGKAIIGRFAIADAQMRVDAGRKKARAMHYPLWIGLEDC